MENQIIEKADFTIDELEPNYYECTFDKCNFSGQSIGRVIFERCTFKECNLSLVKASNTSWLDVLFTDCKMTGSPSAIASACPWSSATASSPMPFSPK